MSLADELKKLAELRAQGVLSDAEFEQQKRILLRATQALADGALDGADDTAWHNSQSGPNDNGRGCLWLLFCGPGAAIMWGHRMFPKSEAEAISAAHRKDNVLLQFLFTLGFYFFGLPVLLIVGSVIFNTFAAPSQQAVAPPPIESMQAIEDAPAHADEPTVTEQETVASESLPEEQEPFAEIEGSDTTGSGNALVDTLNCLLPPTGENGGIVREPYCEKQ